MGLSDRQSGLWPHGECNWRGNKKKTKNDTSWVPPAPSSRQGCPHSGVGAGWAVGGLMAPSRSFSQVLGGALACHPDAQVRG